MSNAKNNNIRYFILIFAGVVIFSLLQMCYHAKIELQNEYSFIISSMDIAQTGSVTFYDKVSNKFYFWNYHVFKRDNFKVGDSVYKAKCSEYLYFYRKNSAGKYNEYLKLKPEIVYPNEWLCD